MVMHEEKEKNCEYLCQECGKTFAVKHYLAAHVYKVHRKKDLMCEHCGSNFTSRNALSNHINFKHSSSKYNCPQCGKAFKDSYALRRHMISHDSSTTKCEYCGKVVKRMDHHRKTCNTEKAYLYSCGECTRNFTDEAYLRKHIVNKHSVDRLKMFCDCGKTYHCQRTLKTHQKKCPLVSSYVQGHDNNIK